MTETLVVILAVAVVILLVVVLLQTRSRTTAPERPALDEARLTALLDKALTARAEPAGRHADDGEQDSPQALARSAAADEELAAGRQLLAARTAELEQAQEAARAARAEADAAGRAVERARAEGRQEAEASFGDARADIDRQRRMIARDKARLAAESATALAAERVDLQAAQQRIAASTDALAEDQRRLAADRERVRADEAEVSRAWAKVAGKEDALRLEAEQLATLGEQVAERSRGLDEQAVLLEAELVRVSGLTAEAARAELLGKQEEVVRRDAAMLVRRIESEAESTAKQRARAIVADAIQRVASDQTAQTVVSVVHLPADEVKGRIIGREGRNIRTFETVTGVNVIIDDTPEAVLLSCFDPVRREIGRVTLEMLIEDGRIHPHRIEEAYERSFDEVEARCARAAEDAMLDVGISDLHPELVTLLGHLKYRTSYGQNVLGHLVETAHIARSMAAELGIDPTVAARGAFLHDIGKALTHEAQGSHAAVGAELARRYGESEDVAHCIEAHHDEVPPSTVEAVLTQAADACSGGRPGARRESLEAYVQRLERIESIAATKKGVEKVFAMQAGRELRVMVKPDVVDDLEAHLLAREVAKQIEEELTYPGQVRVTVIRESRATEVAR
ncbi:ribonuclease Y [Nakamurella lactea]|uniref:ribonuclease Y n=1 Tax=Nakamurella lactea TaxID=459515 RepID=UPI000416DF87|nr:ribonuclease Y [Nakamurella lactea]